MRRAALLALVVAASCAHETHQAQPAREESEAQKGSGAPETAAGEPTPAQTASGVQVAPTVPSGAAVKPLPPKIKIIVRAKGADKALVFWGKKKLGETPVTLERPRDSGPVDLVVRSDGFFAVHTRAYTFHNDVVYVRMTKLEDRMTLFGAKRDVNEPPPGGVPDGGAPPPPATTTPPP